MSEAYRRGSVWRTDGIVNWEGERGRAEEMRWQPGQVGRAHPSSQYSHLTSGLDTVLGQAQRAPRHPSSPSFLPYTELSLAGRAISSPARLARPHLSSPPRRLSFKLTVASNLSFLRFLIVVTFIEDSLRIISQFGDQLWYLQT
jgi:hypothetical protein